MTKEYLGGGKAVGPSEMEDGREKHSYSEGNFYIASTDRHHQSGTVRWEVGRLPRWLIAEVMRWIDSDLTPYRTIPDLVRDAIYHRTHQLREFEADPSFDWGAYETHQRILERARKTQESDAQIKDIEQALTSTLSAGDVDGYKEILEDATRMVPTLREPFAGRLRATVNAAEEHLSKILHLPRYPQNG
jgi:hypothetical protein